MATPIDSIAQYLATDLGLGTLGGTIFEDSLPDDSAGTYDTALAVIGAGGAAPDLAIGGNTDNPGFLVMSRSLSADTALTNLYTVYQALHGLHATDVHGTHFNLIAALHSTPINLGRDERSRWLFSWSFRAIARGVTR